MICCRREGHRDDTTTSVSRLREAINSHDPHRVADCFAPDYRCEMAMHPARGFIGSVNALQNWTISTGSTPNAGPGTRAATDTRYHTCHWVSVRTAVLDTDQAPSTPPDPVRAHLTMH
jgi:hypothetical protein